MWGQQQPKSSWSSKALEDLMGLKKLNSIIILGTPEEVLG
jgi:hypothetical protein